MPKPSNTYFNLLTKRGDQGKRPSLLNSQKPKRLQNSQSLDKGVDIFRSLCVTLLTKAKVPGVVDNVQALQKLTHGMKFKPGEIEDHTCISNHDDTEQSSTIVGRFSFQRVSLAKNHQRTMYTTVLA